MKGIALTSVALSLLLIANLSLALDVSIYPVLNQTQVNIGDTVSMKINIGQVSDLKGVNILISFDNQKLEYESITQEFRISDFAEEIAPNPDAAKDTGRMEYMAVLNSAGPGIDISEGAILTIDFVAKFPGAAYIKLDSNDVPLGNSIANAIPANIDEKELTIQIGQIFELKRVFTYPNPARDKTTIRVEALAPLRKLEAKIYDISSELVKTIDTIDDFSGSGVVYEYEWDCKNEQGQDVANGAYILWLKAMWSETGQDSAKENEIWEYKTWKIAILR